jgi:hypothetical protein
VTGVTIPEMLDDLAGDAAGIERQQQGDLVRYSAAGRAFAEADGAVARFRLRSPIADAALRTPGVTEQGEWIAIETATLDAFTVDRARAWFTLAMRDAQGWS